MAGIKDIAKTRSELYHVNVADLHVKEGWNSRDENSPENVAHIDALAQSIAAEGVKEPVTVNLEDGKLYLENGHMRRLAVIRAIAEYGASPDLLIPARTGTKDATEADRLLSQITRNAGKQLAPLEMAELFKRLQVEDPNLTDAEIARRTGISRVYVGQLGELSKMPKTITRLVRNGDVAATMAIDAMKKFKGDPKKIKDALDIAIATAKSLGKTRATAKHMPKDNSDVIGGEDKKTESKKTSTTSTAPAPTEQRKSSMTMLAETRTLIETATIEREEDDILIVLTVEQFAELTKLLDLENGPDKKRAPLDGDDADDAGNGI